MILMKKFQASKSCYDKNLFPQKLHQRIQKATQTHKKQAGQTGKNLHSKPF